MWYKIKSFDKSYIVNGEDFGTFFSSVYVPFEKFHKWIDEMASFNDYCQIVRDATEYFQGVFSKTNFETISQQEGTPLLETVFCYNYFWDWAIDDKVRDNLIGKLEVRICAEDTE